MKRPAGQALFGRLRAPAARLRSRGVRADSPIKTLKALLALPRGNPGGT